MDTTQKSKDTGLLKFAAYLAYGFLMGLAFGHGYIFILAALLIAILFWKPEWIGYWGVIVISIAFAIAFMVLPGQIYPVQSGLITCGVALVILLILMKVSKDRKAPKSGVGDSD